MPENDFEKQVKRLFDEMRVNPSEKVWPQIHTRVKKDKNRRRILLWLPAAIVLLVTGGYLLTSTMPGSDHHNKEVAGNEIQNVPAEQTREPLSIVPDNPGGKANEEAVAAGENNNQATGENIQNKLTGEELQSAQRINTEKLVNRSGIRQGRDRNVRKANRSASPLTPAPIESNLSTDETGRLSTVQVKKSNIPEQDIQQSAATDIAYEFRDFTGAPLPVTPFTLDAPKTPRSLEGYQNKPVVKLNPKKSWEWGVAAGTGVSSIHNGNVVNILGEKTVERANYDAMSYNNLNSVSGSAALAPQTNMPLALAPLPSEVRRDFSWLAGAYAKWKFKPRLALTGGLQYHQYTTNRTVGDITYPSNANINFSYASQQSYARYSGSYSTGKKYTNRYHFIEMPLGIDWQFSNSRKLPLYLNTGLQLSYLVSSNGIHYDTKAGVYFENKSYFNKMQGGVYLGATAKLFSGTPYALNIGPSVYYNAVNLTKPIANVKQQLIYVGFNMQWAIGTR